MFESTKQFIQHIETRPGTEPLSRKKSQSKRSLYELYFKNPLCLHLTMSFKMVIIMFDLYLFFLMINYEIVQCQETG